MCIYVYLCVYIGVYVCIYVCALPHLFNWLVNLSNS